MTVVEFKDLKFRNLPGNDKIVRADFLTTYYFDIPKSELDRIGEFEVKKGTIHFDAGEKTVWNKFNLILDKGFDNLIHRMRHKPAKYIHKNSGIPLIGTNEFGIVDRGSNILEVKPLTGCNLSCIFCSVSEGINDKRDIVVEVDYLIEEFRKIAKIKDHPIEANIGPQGEPLLYPRLVELVKGLKDTPNVEVVSMNSNGLTLNPVLIDNLAKAGLDRINMSIHADDAELAKELMNGPYNLSRVKKNIRRCEGKIDVLLAPVMIPGYNFSEMDGLIKLAKTINNKRFPTIGLQSYLVYKGGRDIAEEMPWEKFYEILKEKEKEHDMKLVMSMDTFEIKKDNTLPKPFKKKQVVRAKIMEVGRRVNERIAVAEDRCITVYNCSKDNGFVDVRILRNKHNIYSAILA